MEATISGMIRLPEKAVNTEYEVISKDGSRIGIEWTDTAILGDDGIVTGLMKIGQLTPQVDDIKKQDLS